MKLHRLILLSCLANQLATAQVPSTTPPSAPKLETTILDETGVKNLRIETAQAEETNFEETVFAFGRTEAVPQNRSVLSSRISGRIIENKITIGSFVNKGDKLILLESRQPGDPPPAIWLTAPADGTVLAVNAVVGSPIEPSDVLAKFADLSTTYLIVTMPQEIAGKIRQGTEARVRFPIRPDKEYTAVLLKFAACACPDPACALGQDTSTRSNEDDSADRNSASVIFTLQNPDNQLRPGMNAECSIVLNKRANVIGIPRAALQGEASKRFVYVKHFDLPNAFIKTPVQVGQMNDSMVEIVTGLFPADEVVTKGAYSLSFAGGGAGGVSLKEALDAAHGHEHAEDGGELTPEKKAEMEAKKRAASGLPPGTSGGGASPIWMYATGILFLLLLASLFTKLRGAPADEEIATPSTTNPGKH
jgi:membrane fusion protein, heavy metal efflux system